MKSTTIDYSCQCIA